MQELAVFDRRHKVSKCYCKYGADRLTCRVRVTYFWYRVATYFQFVKSAMYAKFMNAQ